MNVLRKVLYKVYLKQRCVNNWTPPLRNDGYIRQSLPGMVFGYVQLGNTDRIIC